MKGDHGEAQKKVNKALSGAGVTCENSDTRPRENDGS